MRGVNGIGFQMRDVNGVTGPPKRKVKCVERCYYPNTAAGEKILIIAFQNNRILMGNRQTSRMTKSVVSGEWRECERREWDWFSNERRE